MSAAPRWTGKGESIVVSHDDGDGLLPAIVKLSGEDGARRVVGRGHGPAGDAEGALYAARKEEIVRFAADGAESVLVRRAGDTMRQPRPSPTGALVAYAAERDDRVELRIFDREAGSDRVAASWERDHIRHLWSADGSRLYVIAPGSWDWELWEVPVRAGSPRKLVGGAASISDLTFSPDGSMIAFLAAPAIDYPHARHRLYLLDPQHRQVREIDVAGVDLRDIAWRSKEAIVAVAAEAYEARLAPRRSSLKQILLADDRIEDLKF
jgi:dipeptidyl aminopeptidase/acylaminoacyl peptidase